MALQQSFRLAAAAGNHDVVDVLLARDEVDAETHDGYPLQAACAGGHSWAIRCKLRVRAVIRGFVPRC